MPLDLGELCICVTADSGLCCISWIGGKSPVARCSFRLSPSNFRFSFHVLCASLSRTGPWGRKGMCFLRHQELTYCTNAVLAVGFMKSKDEP